MNCTRIYLILLLVFNIAALQAQQPEEKLSATYKYAPKWWQSTINLPESPRKVLVGKNGQLMYEYPIAITDTKLTPNFGYNTIISFQADETEVWKGQQLQKSTVPIVITQKEAKGITIQEDAFTVAPLLFGADDNSIQDYLGTALSKKVLGHPGNDIILITLENKSSTAATIAPAIRINSIYTVNADTSAGKISVSDFLRVVVPYSIVQTTSKSVPKSNNEKARNVTTLKLKPVQLAAGEKIQLAFGISQGHTAIDCPNNIEQALLLKKQSTAYWESLNLPYNKIVVPDPEIQNLLNASVRNIYQSIDIENNLPALKTGSTSNRQLYIADAPFIMDALTMLNQKEDARKAIEYMLSFQKDDGSFLQVDNDWKETGFMLWGISSFARLSGDKQWLESVWPNLEKGYTYLMNLRTGTLQNEKAPYAGLLPPGTGSGNQGIDYVNNFWALAGLNSAITAARWLNRNGQAIKWQSQYDEYSRTFQESVKKNMKKDAKGNMYLPARVTTDKKMPPQKAQWAFLNAVYPGKIFDLNDPVVTGNMKMLEGTVNEGLLYNTGWLNNGIVLTSGSDYAHALQWTGKAQEALAVLYALANHAAPNMAWCELQPAKASADTIVTGDMPNNRLSAEFIRTVRHLLVIERGYDLHLLEGVPVAWTQAGMELKLNGVLTEFGTLDFSLKVSDDRTKATLDMNLDTNNRRPPQKIFLHLDGIAGNPATMELELKPNLHKVLSLK